MDRDGGRHAVKSPKNKKTLTSLAHDDVKKSCAALLAPYTSIPGASILDPTLPMWMTRPPRGILPRPRAACVMKMVPYTLTPKMRSSRARSACASVQASTTPALLTV